MQSTIDTCIPDFNSVKIAIYTLIIAKLFHLSTKILESKLDTTCVPDWGDVKNW